MNKTLKKLLKYQRIDPVTLLLKDNIFCVNYAVMKSIRAEIKCDKHLNIKVHKNLLLLNKGRQITT